MRVIFDDDKIGEMVEPRIIRDYLYFLEQNEDVTMKKLRDIGSWLKEELKDVWPEVLIYSHNTKGKIELRLTDPKSIFAETFVIEIGMPYCLQNIIHDAKLVAGPEEFNEHFCEKARAVHKVFEDICKRAKEGEV